MKLWQLGQDAIRVGKIRELCLFGVWELLHILRFGRQVSYLHFSPELPICLEDTSDLSAIDCSVVFTASTICWRMVIADDEERVGFLFNSRILLIQVPATLCVRVHFCFIQCVYKSIASREEKTYSHREILPKEYAA